MGKVKSLYRHTFVYSIGLLFKKAIGFFLIPIYTRAFPTSGYGILGLTYVYISFLILFFSLGLNDAFFKSFTKDKKEKESSSTLLFLRFLYGIPLILILIGFSKPISIFIYGRSIPQYIIIASFIVFIENIAVIPILILRAEERSTLYVLLNTIRFIVNMGLNVYFVVVMKLGILGVLYGDLIALVLLLILSFPFVRKHIQFSLDKKLAKEMWGFGIPLLPISVLMLLLDLSDRYLMRIFKGTSNAGLYILGYQFGSILSLFVNGFRFAWLPFFFKNPDRKDLFIRTTTLFVRLILIMWIGIMLLLPEIFKVWVAKPYYPGMIVSPIVGLAYIFFGLEQIFSAPFYIHSRTKILLPIALIGFSTNFLLNLYFIPHFGIIGAALTTLIAYFVLAVLSLSISWTFHPISYRIGRMALEIIGVTAIYYFLKDLGLSIRVMGIFVIGIIIALEEWSERKIKR